MGEIILRRENVVKKVKSEEAAKALEEKGFVRDGASFTGMQGTGGVTLEKEVEELKKQLEKASEVVALADEKRGAAEKELADTRAKLEEASRYAEDADKKIAKLTQELEGTREQLDTAIKRNQTASEKKK